MKVGDLVKIAEFAEENWYKEHVGKIALVLDAPAPRGQPSRWDWATLLVGTEHIKVPIPYLEVINESR